MKIIFGILLSPLAFALGFLWPLTTQVAVSTGFLAAGWPAIAFGAAIALGFGLLAQIRGSWLWIK